MYGDITAADDYHTARGNTDWGADTAAQTIALQRASDYIDLMFRVRLSSGRWVSQFIGEKATPGQVPEWPRDEVTDYEGTEISGPVTPTEIEYATYEAALRELVTPGSLMPDYDPTATSGSVTQETVGPITVKYADLTQNMEGYENRPPNMPVIPVVERLVAPYLKATATLSGVGIMVV